MRFEYSIKKNYQINKGHTLLELLLASTMAIFLLMIYLHMFFSSRFSILWLQDVTELYQEALWLGELFKSEINMTGFHGCFFSPTSFSIKVLNDSTFILSGADNQMGVILKKLSDYQFLIRDPPFYQANDPILLSNCSEIAKALVTDFHNFGDQQKLTVSEPIHEELIKGFIMRWLKKTFYLKRNLSIKTSAFILLRQVNTEPATSLVDNIFYFTVNLSKGQGVYEGNFFEIEMVLRSPHNLDEQQNIYVANKKFANPDGHYYLTWKYKFHLPN